MAAFRLTFAQAYSRLRTRMPGAQAKELAYILDQQKQDIDQLKTWGDNLTAALNALATKLNADAGVTDTNYVNNNANTGI